LSGGVVVVVVVDSCEFVFVVDSAGVAGALLPFGIDKGVELLLMGLSV
jgi:hypothetical protein